MSPARPWPGTQGNELNTRALAARAFVVVLNRVNSRALGKALRTHIPHVSGVRKPILTNIPQKVYFDSAVDCSLAQHPEGDDDA